MNFTVSYLGRSGITSSQAGLEIALAPNLRRDRVYYLAALRQPLRFREAVSALHDVVVSDLRHQPKDRSDYEAFKAEQQKRDNELRRGATQSARAALLAAEKKPILPDLSRRFLELRRLYWDSRQTYANHLLREQQWLWRLLMPCDPVITVAPDVLFYECFSADESSYGCLTVNRDAFANESGTALGTTNVDYTWTLFEEFQKLRTYRHTQFKIDPSGFEVYTQDQPSYREEKIDLPPSWLRGFMQMQSAMSLPMRRVPVSREGLYNVLAWLKRHKAARSPRAVRFELQPGQPVTIVLEPWDKRIVLHSTPYTGAKAETIRTWGRDRLRVLARLLPLAEGADVYLLGTGLPSFWSVRMGEMRMLLGLSGWTANDWTSASALDQIAPPAEPSNELVASIAAAFQESPTLTFTQVCQRTGGAGAYVAAGLNRLALLGQLIHDLPAGVYRWRQIMPVPVSLAEISPDNPETLAARELVRKRQVSLSRDERTPSGLRVLSGVVGATLAGVMGGQAAEVVLDGDGRIIRGSCKCSHHFKSGIRRGPCRHLQALRNAVREGTHSLTLEAWFSELWR